MKIKDFKQKVEDLYMGCAMDTHVYWGDCGETMPQWIGTEWYTYKDQYGNDVKLQVHSPTSYTADAIKFNVMCCFSLSCDEYSDYYHTLANMMEYLNKYQDEITDDDELYVMIGQSIDENYFYEITDIDYDYDRAGAYIKISTKRISIEDARPNIADEKRVRMLCEKLGIPYTHDRNHPEVQEETVNETTLPELTLSEEEELDKLALELYPDGESYDCWGKLETDYRDYERNIFKRGYRYAKTGIL